MTLQVESLHITGNAIIGGSLIYMDQKNSTDINEIKQDVKDLKKEITEIKMMLERIYYAPGMPGYYEAKDHFDECLKRQRTE